MSFEVTLGEGSFVNFLRDQIDRDQTHTVRNQIEQNLTVNGYSDFFNYGLNTTTWRHFVNKQILMKYERLFIEKQMNEFKTKKSELER